MINDYTQRNRLYRVHRAIQRNWWTARTSFGVSVSQLGPAAPRGEFSNWVCSVFKLWWFPTAFVVRKVSDSAWERGKGEAGREKGRGTEYTEEPRPRDISLLVKGKPTLSNVLIKATQIASTLLLAYLFTCLAGNSIFARPKCGWSKASPSGSILFAPAIPGSIHTLRQVFAMTLQPGDWSDCWVKGPRRIQPEDIQFVQYLYCISYTLWYHFELVA